VDHLDDSRDGGLAKLGEPFGQRMRPLGDLAADPAPHDVVSGQLGDHRQQRGGLDQVDVEEGPHQLVEGRHVRIRRLLERAGSPGFQSREQRADERHKRKWVVVSEGDRDISHQVGLLLPGGLPVARRSLRGPMLLALRSLRHAGQARR
jgi:hypothetical protein